MSWFARFAAFAAVLVVCLAVGARYVWKRVPGPQEPRPAPTVEHTSALSRVRSAPHLVFLEPQKHARARLAVAPLDDLEHGRIVTDVEADRVYAAGRTYLCLGAFVTSEGFAQEGAFLVDETLKITRTIAIPGIPSRVRTSVDGRRGAVTLFVSGDSYAAGGFSTRTYVFDLAGEGQLFNLERLRTLHQGEMLSPTELNFWGVTFAHDAQRFYATVKDGDLVVLVEGSTETSEASTIPVRVECPSLSPDGKRIAFKHLPGPTALRWWPAVMDVATQDVRVVQGEPRSIDDQVEWLDDHRILYSLKRPNELGGVASDVWVLDVDTEAPSQVFLRDAVSPCVVRP